MSGVRFSIVFALIFFVSLLVEAQEETTFTYKDACLTIEDKQEGFRLKVKSNYFLQGGGIVPVADFSMLRQDDEPLRMGGNFNFKSMRTILHGQIDEHWHFKFDIDYGAHKLSYKDMKVEYRFNQYNCIVVGNMRVPGPMSVNFSTSANMQLSKPIGLSLASGRRLGLTYYYLAPELYGALGLYTYNMNNVGSMPFEDGPELAIAGRLGYSFLSSHQERLFGGISGYYHRLQGGVPGRKLTGSIESKLSDHRFVKADIPDGKNMCNMGMELAYQKGRFLTYGEVMMSSIDVSSGYDSLNFWGWSATASYVILGQARAYNSAKGDFTGSPYTDMDRGLEAGVRVSGLTLNSGQLVGGAGVSYSTFMSYWLNQHLSFMAQISFMDHSADALGAGAYKPVKGDFRGADFVTFQLRVGIVF